MHGVDTAASRTLLMRLLSVEGVTGKEAAIGKELVATLQEIGVPGAASASMTLIRAFLCQPKPAT
jgi:hypothetical protein